MYHSPILRNFRRRIIMKLTKLISLSFCTIIMMIVQLSAQPTETIMSEGNMFLSNGAYDQAIVRFQKVLGRDPGNFEAQFNIAFAYLSWGRNSQAVTAFKRAASMNPRNADIWSNLAMAYENMGKSEKALQSLYKAVEYNPSNVQARINLATVYANKNRLNDAIRAYKGVIEVDGTNLDAHINLAKCLISKKKLDEAERYLKSAIAIAPMEAESYWELGNVLWNKDRDTSGAIKNYEKAIKLNPNSELFYNNLALLYEGMNNKVKALETWKAALVYMDDALQKEEIERRVELLEKGESPSGKVSAEELFGNTKMEAGEKVEREGDQASTEPVKTINTQGVDVGGDLDDLFGDDNSSSKSFDTDILQ